MIALTKDNFHTEIWNMPAKLGLSRKNFLLLLEAFRRKHILSANPYFYGLGMKSHYKSKLFEYSSGPVLGRDWVELPRVNNWYKLTKLGEEKLALLETIICIEKQNKNEVNELIFTYE